MRRRRSLALTLLVAGLAMFAAAGAHPAGGADEARKGGILRMGSFEDVGQLDTALGYGGPSWAITFATCAKLFNHPDEDGAAGARVIPEVVRSYTVSRDRRTYDFELRRTFRFHTGVQVTAQSFAAAFNRNAHPGQKATDATGFMREIEGAQAMIDGNAQSISGVRVVGRYRLQIRLTKPLGDFPQRLTLPFFCPVLPGTPVDSRGVDPAGSGPYYVAEHVVNQRVVLKRNPFYRGDRPANVGQVVWTVGETREACLVAIEADRIDHCFPFGVPSAAYGALAERYGVNRPGGQFFVSPAPVTWYLAFNHDRPAFKGPGQIPLKKAINFALDRAALVRPLGYLAGKRTDQILPPALGRAVGIYPLGGPNLAAAKRWLARARIKPTKLMFYTTSAPSSVAQSLALEFQLKQIGIDLDVKYFDAATLVEKIQTRGEPFDIARDGWAADYADGGSFLETLLDGRRIRPTGSLNVAYFDDPPTNARIDAAKQLTGDARRKASEDLDVELMRTNPPWAPLYNTFNRSFVSKSFGCFLYHPFYGVDLAAACKR
ncbi:MAG TPA: ABC transporter substrate-binding protein [Gaiella sp.]|uniref:peptide ABC transporter substrate-binding protein n=1 Tax=Gaiella sp. TaxID=2663207 RepID=UPI002D7E531F|nr:ABC transporter substrate-binding protein [Gaiella sp.]HET9286842.1 ABC transporter substrate-binding protein [Gaiella sp.]